MKGSKAIDICPVNQKDDVSISIGETHFEIWPNPFKYSEKPNIEEITPNKPNPDKTNSAVFLLNIFLSTRMVKRV